MDISSQKSGASLWNVEKIIKKGEYLYAIVRDHPRSTKNGYVLEHRIVMENHLGRLLDANEIVHHVNGNKHDNRIDNLELSTTNEHAKTHAILRGRSMLMLKCPMCGKYFRKRKRCTHVSKGASFTTCSKSCGSKFAWMIRKSGETERVQTAISENIVFEYNSNDNSEQTEITGCVETIRRPPEMAKK